MRCSAGHGVALVQAPISVGPAWMGTQGPGARRCLWPAIDHWWPTHTHATAQEVLAEVRKERQERALLGAQPPYTRIYY